MDWPFLTNVGQMSLLGLVVTVILKPFVDKALAVQEALLRCHQDALASTLATNQRASGALELHVSDLSDNLRAMIHNQEKMVEAQQELTELWRNGTCPLNGKEEHEKVA